MRMPPTVTIANVTVSAATPNVTHSADTEIANATDRAAVPWTSWRLMMAWAVMIRR